MIETLYIEQAVLDHPRSVAIRQRFPHARVVTCERYGEVFNPKGQNFRLQKQRPALILARKHDHWVLEAPLGYNIGGRRNYYFSHMLNCIYDCRYCFLQGMYRSANYVLFVNYEDFHGAIEQRVAESDETTWFFSGYDCDSLALEPVTGFMQHTLPLFRNLDKARLELRTKSTQIRSLLEMEAMPNCVVAFSLSPAVVAEALEHKAAPLPKRLDALEKLQQAGWPVGLRFDPLIYCDEYQRLYSDFFEQVFTRIDLDGLHSVSLGAFRMPQGFYRNMVKLYPQEKLFAGPLAESQPMVSYETQLEQEMLAFCREKLLQLMPEEKLFICQDDD
ncbi:DNA photolyase [Candidatus Tenderia electrophaga]|jgi:spore photoproduct lyase|uniref:DNA photolyase n=1 Tax=Candidatus Tenderia electrophaga TaxID=1748243 RepID=A0A0S2TAR0_9GAMM|nr:DNA photolyase [Candidatus Tenderia electrophaga]